VSDGVDNDEERGGEALGLDYACSGVAGCYERENEEVGGDDGIEEGDALSGACCN